MINVTIAEAAAIITELRNGKINHIGAGKNGRAWVEGEFNLAELEALCVLIRGEAGDNALGAEELIKYWREAGMM